MLSEVFWRFVLLETLVIGIVNAEGCNEHLQKKFCRSEFVLKAVLPLNRDFKDPYRVRPKLVFKGDVRDLNVVQDRFITLHSRSVLDSMPERQLFIFGRNKNGTIYADLCEGILPREWMTQFQLKALREFYYSGCDCIEKIGKYTRPMFCKWQLSYQRRHEGNCTWLGSAALDICERRTLGSMQPYEIYM